MHRFEKDGVEGLKDKKGRGRRSALSDAQLARIKTLVLKKTPEKHGFKSKKWMGPLLVQWIKREYGLEYHKAQFIICRRKSELPLKRKLAWYTKCKYLITFIKSDEESISAKFPT